MVYVILSLNDMQQKRPRSLDLGLAFMELVMGLEPATA